MKKFNTQNREMRKIKKVLKREREKEKERERERERDKETKGVCVCVRYLPF
jgi:hypothetical protein